MSEFQNELTALIDRHSLENGSETPDFILAEYLQRCIWAWEAATNMRERWYGRRVSPENCNVAPASPEQIEREAK